MGNPYPRIFDLWEIHALYIRGYGFSHGFIRGYKVCIRGLSMHLPSWCGTYGAPNIKQLSKKVSFYLFSISIDIHLSAHLLPRFYLNSAAASRGPVIHVVPNKTMVFFISYIASRFKLEK